jgi:hypothetical protein
MLGRQWLLLVSNFNLATDTVLYILRLLPLQDYGPRALRQGVHGWGSYSVTGEWIAAAPGYNPDQHVTRRLYENYKLSNSGMLHDQIRPVYAAAVNERIAKQRLGG